jgi:hypothetical protein
VELDCSWQFRAKPLGRLLLVGAPVSRAVELSLMMPEIPS